VKRLSVRASFANMINAPANENKENAEDQWLHAVLYANKAGGIVPGRAISFKSTPNRYVIKAHWGRWIGILVVFVFGFVSILPVIIPFIIPVPPAKEFPFLKVLPLVAFGLFVLYLAFRSSTRVGKIVFNTDASNVHITYGTLFRRYRVTIPQDHVSLKAYMFKTDKPDLRIRYGYTVLSLINEAQTDSELILASTEKEKTIRAVLGELGSKLNTGVTKNITGAEVDEPYLSSVYTGHDEWQKIVENSQSKKPFLNNLVSSKDKLIVKEYAEHILIKNKKAWFLGFLLLSLGLFLILMLIIVSIKEEKFDIFVSLMTFAVSLIFLVPAFTLIASDNRVVLKRLSNSIHLQYGFHPFVKKLSFLKSEFDVSLYKCDFERANRVKTPGQVVLSIVRSNMNNSELILITSDTEPQIRPAFDKLQSFIGQASTRELSQEIVLSTGEQVSIATTSLSGNSIEVNKRKLHIINENMAAFKSNWFHVALGAFLFISGLTTAVYFLSGESDEEFFQRIVSMGLILLICGLTMLVGIGFFFHSLSTRCIVADKEAGTLHYSPFANPTAPTAGGKTIVKLSEIEAVQLCSLYTSVQSGKTRRGTTVYEINLVTNDSKNRRITIAATEKHEQIMADANAFAEFLGVPMLDHTQLLDRQPS